MFHRWFIASTPGFNNKECDTEQSYLCRSSCQVDVLAEEPTEFDDPQDGPDNSAVTNLLFVYFIVVVAVVLAVAFYVLNARTNALGSLKKKVSVISPEL